MKKMKCFIALMLVALLVLPYVSTVNAAHDEEAPVINGVTVKEYDANHTYTSGEVVQVKFDATDNMQILSAHVSLRDTVTLQEYDFSYYAYSAGDYDKLVVEISIDELPTATYEMIRISVSDAAGNSTQKELIGAEVYTIQVNNPTYGQDANMPQVKMISVTPNAGNSVTTDFTYTTIIEAGASEVKYVSLGLDYTYNSTQSFTMEKTENKDEYKVTVNIYDSFQLYIDKVAFGSLYVEVENGNTYSFYPEDSELVQYGFPAIDGVKKEDLEIKFTDIEKDTDLPILEKFKYEKPVIFTPDEMKIHVTATDNTSTVNDLRVIVFEEGKDGNYFNMDCGGFWDSVTGKTKNGTVTIDFPRYHDGGKFYVNEIVLTDVAGNTASYSIGNGDFEKRIFEVKNHNKYDYMTSTSAPDLLDVIRQAASENGKTVVVNVDPANSIAPKELFEIIADKNVKVIFEKVYDYEAGSGSTDEGLQWIMEGKDIDKGKAKDIDVYFYIEMAWNTSYWDEQLKLHGGVDPRVETDGPIDFEKVLIDAGWEDFVKEIEKMKKPHEDFIDAYDRICFTPYVRVVFPDNGELPGKTTIRFKPSYSMRYWNETQPMKLYYKDEKNGKFDLVEKNINMHSEGYYQFHIYHNSEYAFTDEFYSQESVATNNNSMNDSQSIEKAPQTGDKMDIKLPIAVMCLALATVAAVASKRKKSKK